VPWSDGLLLVSASWHAAAATFYASLHRATGRDEHRALARFAGALAVYVAAVVVLGAVAAPGLQMATRVVRLLMGNLAAAGLVELCAVLAGEPGAAQRKWYAVFSFAFVSAYGGVYLLTGELHEALDAYRLPEGLPIVAQSVVVFSIFAWAVARLARTAQERGELRPIVTSIGVVMILGLVDELTHWRTGARAHLPEHGGLVVVIVSTVALARRQALAVEELRLRSLALGEAHEALAETHRARRQRESLAALGELSAVVAHEVRNPLAIVKNAVSSLRRPALDPVDRSLLLQIVSEESRRLARLVRDLLAFARPRASVPVRISVAELVERAARDATRGEPTALERVELALADGLELDGDAELLRLALANVLENGLQASDGAGRVRLEARTAPGESMEIVVSDTGRGMSEDVLKKARDPFFTTRPTGTGLGLAIVDRVVRSHGGWWDIESRPGAGCTVRMTLPLEVSAHAAPGAALEGGRA
jgi:signal transduction histidine kinase